MNHPLLNSFFGQICCLLLGVCTTNDTQSEGERVPLKILLSRKSKYSKLRTTDCEITHTVGYVSVCKGQNDVKRHQFSLAQAFTV